MLMKLWPRGKCLFLALKRLHSYRSEVLQTILTPLSVCIKEEQNARRCYLQFMGEEARKHPVWQLVGSPENLNHIMLCCQVRLHKGWITRQPGELNQKCQIIWVEKDIFPSTVSLCRKRKRSKKCFRPKCREVQCSDLLIKEWTDRLWLNSRLNNKGGKPIQSPKFKSENQSWEQWR